VWTKLTVSVHGNGCSRFLWNCSTLVADCTASYPRWQ